MLRAWRSQGLPGFSTHKICFIHPLPVRESVRGAPHRMKTNFSGLRNRAAGLAAVVVAFLLPASPARASIDADGDGLSDVWESAFNAGALVADALAPDGSGMTNRQKCAAGLNPFDPKARLKISAAELAGGNVTLHWASVVGKRYQVYTSADIAVVNSWQPLGGPLLGNGGELGPTFAITGATQIFFKVTVSDIDSDGDGLSDWEERQLGFDPYSATTDGLTSDYTRAQAALTASTATVTMSASDSFAAAASADLGAFTILRSGRPEAITVALSVAGTAIVGIDFQALPASVTLPFGINSATVRVTPLPTAATTARTVILSANPGAGYTVGAPANATVSLAPTPGTGAVLQEVWYGLAWGAVDLIPQTQPPTTSRLLTTLEQATNALLGDNYGTRIRGYLIAPTTGNYTFWIASDDQSELWIANDDQPASLVKRANVSSWTGRREWNKEPNQKSTLLALTAGRKYYFEVLQANGGGGENLSVGWLKPGQTGTVPSEIVGATAGTLAPYVPVVRPPDGSTLYFTNLVPQSGVTSSGRGSATLRLSADETFAVVAVNYSGLTGPKIAWHVHGPADANQSAGILFDLDTTPPQADGTYLWTITQAGANTPADIVTAIKAGRTYVNVHTAQYPNGEIRGQFARSAATGSFTPPPAPPALPPGLPTANDAARFLTQATFGPTTETIAQVQANGFDAWLNEQFAAPLTLNLPQIDARIAAGEQDRIEWLFEAWWKNALTAPDQLRQRVAFALSEILVVSSNRAGLEGEVVGLSNFYDLLLRDAFGNFRQLLEDATLNPAMGQYLDMVHNDKPDPATGQTPNENYAREILQLFSIGLNKLNPDGTLVLDAQSRPVPTYDQAVVSGFAGVFTGWYWAQSGTPVWWYVGPNFRAPMQVQPAHHDSANPKRLLDNVVLPAGQTPAQDLKDAHDLIFNHPNVGPFICRQLIQRLVTSNPSPAYVYRVAQAFANNGQGVRGDLKAVVRAILLDYEARTTTVLGAAGFGHQREPLLRLANVHRAFHSASQTGEFQTYDLTDSIGQNPYLSPTVFNFFYPDYVQPGPLATAGLVAPEFQITTDSTAIGSANVQRDEVFRVASQTPSPFVIPNLSAQTALASNPTALVDSLNVLLLNGQMSSQTRTILINAITAIPASNPLLRAQSAVYLIVTSPDFVIAK